METRNTGSNRIVPEKDPTGRNESCICGSGKKYKKCCLPRKGTGITEKVVKSLFGNCGVQQM